MNLSEAQKRALTQAGFICSVDTAIIEDALGRVECRLGRNRDHSGGRGMGWCLGVYREQEHVNKVTGKPSPRLVLSYGESEAWLTYEDALIRIGKVLGKV